MYVKIPRLKAKTFYHKHSDVPKYIPKQARNDQREDYTNELHVFKLEQLDVFCRFRTVTAVGSNVSNLMCAEFCAIAALCKNAKRECERSTLAQRRSFKKSKKGVCEKALNRFW